MARYGTRHFDRNFDRWIVSISGLTFLASAALLMDDRFLFRIGPPPAGGETIARVSRSENDVRRRKEEELSWLGLREPEDVFQADSVYTGEDSDAEVVFKNGSKIVIDPNSLVILSAESGRTQVNLKSGGISGILSSKATLTFINAGKTGEIRADQAHVRIVPEQEGTLQVTVLSGTAEVHTENSKTLMHQNQQLRISAEGKTESVKTFTLSLLSPPADSAVWKKASDAIRFEWADDGGPGRSYRLEVSSSGQFTHPLLSKELQRTSMELTHLPEQGVLYWRVVGLGEAGEKNGAESPVYKFSIKKKALLPAPIVPRKETDFELKSGRDNPENGRREARLSFLDLLIPSASAAEAGAAPVLEWVPVPGAVSYYLEVSDSKNLGSIIFETRTQSPRYLWNAPEPGVYFWRVAGIDSDGDQGQLSDPAILRVRISPPEPKTSERVTERVAFWEDFQKNPAQIKLSWSQVRFAKAYQVQIGKDPDFHGSPVYEGTIAGTSLEIPLKETGKLYWRVRPLDERQRPIGRYCDTASLQYDRVFSLEAPAPADPPDGQNFTVLRDSPVQVPLTWKAIPSARQYEVQFSKSADFSEVLSTALSDDNQAQAPSELPQGIFYWRVRAKREEYRSGWSSPRAFSVNRERSAHRSLGVQAMLGLSSISYSETQSRDYSSISALLQLGYSRDLQWPRWSLVGGSHVTLLPLTTNIPGTTLRTFGADSNLSYAIPGLKPPWKLEALGGAFYQTTLTTTDSFGYHNMYGPQLLMALLRNIGSDDSARGYARVSIAIPSGGLPSLSNSEIGGGVSWIHSAQDSRPLVFSLDYSRLSLNFSDVLLMSSTAVTLAVGTSL